MLHRGVQGEHCLQDLVDPSNPVVCPTWRCAQPTPSNSGTNNHLERKLQWRHMVRYRDEALCTEVYKFLPMSNHITQSVEYHEKRRFEELQGYQCNQCLAFLEARSSPSVSPLLSSFRFGDSPFRGVLSNSNRLLRCREPIDLGEDAGADFVLGVVSVAVALI